MKAPKIGERVAAYGIGMAQGLPIVTDRGVSARRVGTIEGFSTYHVSVAFKDKSWAVYNKKQVRRLKGRL